MPLERGSRRQGQIIRKFKREGNKEELTLPLPVRRSERGGGYWIASVASYPYRGARNQTPHSNQLTTFAGIWQCPLKTW
jgi:hypothetical protein